MRPLLSLAGLLVVASALPAQTWRPALARPDTAPACERPVPQLGLQFGLNYGLQLGLQRDRLPPLGRDQDREIQDILRQWPGVLRRLDRLELELRGAPLPPRADPRGELCPRCPPPEPVAPRYLPPAAADPLGGYQRYQGAGTVRR